MKQSLLYIKGLLASLLIGLSFNGLGNEAPVVQVGGYQFPPFVSFNKGQASGISLELITALNDHQNDVRFVFVPTSPKRRYYDFERGAYDIILFESILWGWQDKAIQASQVFLTGGEVYITRRDEKKTQAYFSDFKDKKMVGVLGYHYGFANYISDTKVLQKEFNMRTVSSPVSILNQVNASASDIGIITESFLKTQLAKNPRLTDDILISEKKDQEYRHTILVRKDGSVSIEKINQWLSEMRKNGTLTTLFKPHNLHNNLPSP